MKETKKMKELLSILKVQSKEKQKIDSEESKQNETKPAEGSSVEGEKQKTESEESKKNNKDFFTVPKNIFSTKTILVEHLQGRDTW